MVVKIRVKNKTGNDTSENSINIGTAKHLYGKIHVLSIFVAKESNPWNRTNIDRTINKLTEAQRWLKMQSARYDKRLDFINTVFGENPPLYDNHIPDNFDSSNAYYYACELIQRIGFGNNESYMRWVSQNTDCDQCFVIIFCNKDGRSYASPVNKKLIEYDPFRYNLECCLLYSKYPNSNIETTTASIAHEILHLFGAWDLYELEDKDKPRADKCKMMFPNSIMVETYRDIWETQIDEINAWLVGLKDGKDWYRWFEPDQDTYLSE